MSLARRVDALERATDSVAGGCPKCQQIAFRFQDEPTDPIEAKCRTCGRPTPIVVAFVYDDGKAGQA